MRIFSGIAIALCSGLFVAGAQTVTPIPIDSALQRLLTRGAQNTTPRPTDGDLELRLQPEDIHHGIPESFTFSLVNRSDHDIKVPTLAIECEGPALDGDLRLKVNFTPLYPDSPAFGRVCTNDAPDKRTISERVKTWEVLHPGESVVLHATRKRLAYDCHLPGTYEFLAYYDPPAMSSQDRKTLVQAGVVFPQNPLTTAPVRFIKKK